ncbi:MBL fold metallo-hydrolase [Pseudonocardia endophytica]|uniref:Metallo-beta-lactamase domain-containing protein n=1 Tax=Pseudonocardia endophytica TaxID=401976 RepID=A0A4R1HTK0_PSEEN|nr:MBL fold metallo-hydrolase [Pseudonocardia endophytica]TCK25997.1 hypothetical protein EV378_1824 [Pseudonocardia endophytica]
MTAWICVTCGVQHPDAPQPPPGCAVCEDERQFVGPDGQRWTAPDELAAGHRTVLAQVEADLVGIGVEPSFAIGQRALLVRTPDGNVLWDCVPLLDDHARAEVAALGGIHTICVSHPHFHAAMVDWADHFDARILLARSDVDWVRRPSDRVEVFDEWSEPVPGVTVVRVGGHFAGSTVLHRQAADGRGVLLTGDSIQVVADRRWVSFLWSYPNMLPLDERTVLGIAERVGAFRFERLYGGWWERRIDAGADEAVARSAERYVARLRGERPDGHPSRPPGS